MTAASATALSVIGPFNGLFCASTFNLTVDADDSYGNVDPTFNDNVTLALANNPSNGALAGTLTVPAVDGVAIFSGLTINDVGNGYTLQATSSGLTAGTSVPFNVANDQLVVTSPPANNVTAGSGFGLSVSAEDGLGTWTTLSTAS